MAQIQDTAKTFTITLTALLQGLATINIVYFDNLTSGISSSWTPTRDWNYPLEAVEGDNIRVVISVQNDGSTTDTIWTEMLMSVGTPNEPTLREQVLDPDSYTSFNWTFTMPASDVDITINAGHVE